MSQKYGASSLNLLWALKGAKSHNGKVCPPQKLVKTQPTPSTATLPCKFQLSHIKPITYTQKTKDSQTQTDHSIPLVTLFEKKTNKPSKVERGKKHFLQCV